VPGLVLLNLWIPVFDHYYLAGVEVTDEMLNAARQLPSDLILEELKDFRFFGTPWTNEQQMIDVATKLLKGEAAIPGYPEAKIRMPFEDDDLDRGLGRWQFLVAQFRIPKILLDAYKASGRTEFIRMARDVIVEWALYERSAWLPKGYLWNDHAVAERMLVLAEFWRLYRHHPDFDPTAARIVLELVAHNSQLLAKPGHYTFSSNHGVMQNLALWHFCLAFPALPNVEQYKQLALARMRDQMTFYMNDEGVVLEHSAGYQTAGLRFLGMALRYLTLMNVPIPGEWAAKYERARGVYAQLRRPNGSLPVFGDTHPVKEPMGPPVTNVDAHGRAGVLEYLSTWMPPRAASLYPIAGYSVWWDGLDTWPNPQKLAQTVVAWSYFPGHAHKHADEMSVLLWAGGRTWWTNVGYWPYRVEGRSVAVSWEGSNAPHLVSEGTSSKRTTRLRSYGWSDNAVAVDVQRSGPKKFVARRQVLHLKPNVWVVIDHVSGNGEEKSITRWRTSKQISIREDRRAGSYSLLPEDHDSILTAFIFGSDHTEVKHVNDVFESVPRKPSVESAMDVGPQIVVEQPATNSWAVAVWVWDNGVKTVSQFVETPRMAHWEDAENWKLALTVSGGTIDVWRGGNLIFIRNHIGSIETLALKFSNESELIYQSDRIRNAYIDTSDKYQKFNAHLRYRIKVTQMLILILVSQGFFLAVYKRGKGRHYEGIKITVLGVWTSIWIIFIPFFDVIIQLYARR
jgi:Heparinase II/III N-terminus/Heparinase II/III-like protein